jgi:hypothetical protein
MLGLTPPDQSRPLIPSGNPLWDEIQQAHSNLSPAAQKAIAASGIPQQAEAVETAEAAPPSMAAPEPAPVAPLRPISPPSNVRGLGSPSPAPAPIASAPQTPEASAHLAELNRVTAPPLQGPLANTKADTGRSGIGQIKNRFARTGLRILDAAGSALLPNFTSLIPGTELHHRDVVDQARATVDDDTERLKSEAAANESNARAQSLVSPVDKTDTPFKLWRAQNPGAPAETWLKTEEGAKFRNPDQYADFKAGYAKAHPDATPDQIVEAFATKSQQPSLPAMYAEAVNAVLEAGGDPSEDPRVKQIAEAMQEGLRQPAPKVPAKDDKAIAIMQKKDAGQPLTPEETSYLSAYNQWVRLTKVNPGVERAMIFVNGRLYPTLDTEMGNAPSFANPNQIQGSPGRFLPSGPGTTALNKTALLEDIRGNVQQVRQSLQAIPDFNTMDKAKIAVALRHRDPRGTVNALINSGAINSMSPAQQEYLINVTNLVENAMAMRSVLGAGQGSDDLRAAIMATIPGPSTPSREYAMKQLDTFERVLDRLGAGVPRVQLRGGGQEAPEGHGPAQGGYVIGRSYQGQKYLGGDPNDAKNWSK